MRLGPFGRAEQAGLLAVPAGIDDRAIGLPSVPGERADRLGLGQHGAVAGERIGGAEHPAVAVVGADHPFVGVPAALHHRDHVVERLHRPVGLDREMRGHRIRTAIMIGERQAAARLARRDRALEARQQLGRVGIGDRQRRNLEDRRRGLAGQPPGVGGGAHARGQRIARIGRHVLHRAALHRVFGAPAAARIGIILGIAVIARIRIDQAADRAMFLRQLGLQPAPARAVAREHDLAAHVDPAPRQRLVIVGHTVIDVDDGRGDVAVALIGDIRRQRAGGVGRGLVARHRRLLAAQRHALRGDHLDRRRDRRRIEHREGLDVRVPAPALEQRERGLGILPVVGAADLIGGGGEILEPGELVGARDRGVERGFGGACVGGGGEGERVAQAQREQRRAGEKLTGKGHAGSSPCGRMPRGSSIVPHPVRPDASVASASALRLRSVRTGLLVHPIPTPVRPERSRRTGCKRIARLRHFDCAQCERLAGRLSALTGTPGIRHNRSRRHRSA